MGRQRRGWGPFGRGDREGGKVEGGGDMVILFR